jgi:5-methylcytosine-specific restriction endonuclease McrA
MKKHTKIYMQHFDYDVILCEYCNAVAVDIHHIEPRGMGGSKTKDFIANLVALCRSCHIKAEQNKEFNKKVKEIHLKNI